MKFEAFKETLKQAYMPAKLPAELQALWLDARGEWDKAHRIVQAMSSVRAAWVHAYLHRKEPDEWNASYWYSRAGKNKPECSFEQEWEELCHAILNEDF